MKIEETIEYNIDYDFFSTQEVIKIIKFFKDNERYYRNKKVNINQMKEDYKAYRTILGSKSLEKKYDKFLEKHYGYSIYKNMRKINNENR